MPRKKAKQSLEDWIAETTTKSHGPAWKRLPSEALDEIKTVLAYNDKHPGATIPQPAFLERIANTYGIQLTRAALDHYLTTELGRRWRNSDD